MAKEFSLILCLGGKKGGTVRVVDASQKGGLEKIKSDGRGPKRDGKMDPPKLGVLFWLVLQRRESGHFKRLTREWKPSEGTKL